MPFVVFVAGKKSSCFCGGACLHIEAGRLLPFHFRDIQSEHILVVKFLQQLFIAVGNHVERSASILDNQFIVVFCLLEREVVELDILPAVADGNGTQFVRCSLDFAVLVFGHLANLGKRVDCIIHFRGVVALILERELDFHVFGKRGRNGEAGQQRVPAAEPVAVGHGGKGNRDAAGH